MLELTATIQMLRRTLRQYGDESDGRKQHPVGPVSRSTLGWAVAGVVLAVVLIGLATLR